MRCSEETDVMRWKHVAGGTNTAPLTNQLVKSKIWSQIPYFTLFGFIIKAVLTSNH